MQTKFPQINTDLIESGTPQKLVYREFNPITDEKAPKWFFDTKVKKEFEPHPPARSMRRILPATGNLPLIPSSLKSHKSQSL